jgi:uncharacterized protein (DUF736 family)
MVLKAVSSAFVRRSVVPNNTKTSDDQPDYRVRTQGVEIGAGWVRTGQTSGKDYVSLSLAAPEFGPRKLYANLGMRGRKQSVYVIWADKASMRGH